MGRQKRLRPIEYYLRERAPAENSNAALIAMFEQLARSGDGGVSVRRVDRSSGKTIV